PAAFLGLVGVLLLEFQLVEPCNHFRSEPQAQEQGGDRRARAPERDVTEEPQRRKALRPNGPGGPFQQALAQMIKHQFRPVASSARNISEIRSNCEARDAFNRSVSPV